jgi:PKD repeat protein
MKFRLLLLFPLFFAFRLSAQCSGDYTYFANGTSISFISTTSPGVTDVWWDFGDGNYDFTNNPSPTHTYAGTGSYTACIIVFDSVANCTDSTCHTVIIDSCYASISYTTSGLTGYFTGYANGGSPNSVYMWSFGDNTTANTATASHTYANAGTYTVCFAYYDLISGCSDSVCTPVTFGGCMADFTWIDSLGYVFFFGNSTLGSSGNYIWDFGDATTSYMQYPSHNYANPGTYQVCLTVYDSLQNFCDSTCHMLSVNNVSGVNEEISLLAQISFSPDPANENTELSFISGSAGEANIFIYDIAGRALDNPLNKEVLPGKNHFTINTRDLPEGIYLLQITVNGQTANSKLFVTHR